MKIAIPTCPACESLCIGSIANSIAVEIGGQETLRPAISYFCSGQCEHRMTVVEPRWVVVDGLEIGKVEKNSQS